MKKYLYIITIATLLLNACSKKNDEIHPAQQTVTIKDAGDIQFKAIPLAQNELKLAFQQQQDKQVFSKAILKQNSTILATAAVTVNSDGSSSATFNYAFEAGKTYDFLVQTTPASNVVNQYKISGYTHTYVSFYNYKNVMPLHQSLGPDGFDISPSHNYIFVSDDVNNTIQLKRLSLQTLAVDNLSYNLMGSPIRAVSDNELLVIGDKNTANMPAKADPGTDAEILAKYNMSTKALTFVDYVSSSYGRISRVIDNHVLVTNPINTAKTASLINLATLSSVKYPLENFSFANIDEYSFNHILYNNMLVNTNTGQFTQPVNLDGNSGLVEIDDATGYGFVTSAVLEPNTALTAFSVYKNKTQVYKSAFVQGRTVYFPIIYNIKNDVLTFYQYFGYDTKVNIDGYYTLNIKTGETKLIQADSDPYVRSDYQLKDGSVFSVKADGVYKLTPR